MSKDFNKKLNLLFDFYTTFRFHAENRMNVLKYTQLENPNPSDKVELEHLKVLIENANTLFPHAIPLQDFKIEITKNHNLMNRMIELRDTSPLSHEELITELLKFTDEHK